MSSRRHPYDTLTGVTLVTGALAAQEAGVVPATIRKWAQLGHLRPSGQQGRSHLYRLEDVFAAERATRRTPRRKAFAPAPAGAPDPAAPDPAPHG